MKKSKTQKSFREPVAGGKKKFRFNIIDIILLVIILAAVAALVYIFMPSKTVAEEPVASNEIPVTYQLLITDVFEELRGKINIGDAVVDSVTLYNIGEVVDVVYSDSVFRGIDMASAEYVYSPYPGRVDITVTVSANAVKNGADVTVNGFRVAVGKLIPFRVPGFTSGAAYCISLEEANG